MKVCIVWQCLLVKEEEQMGVKLNRGGELKERWGDTTGHAEGQLEEDEEEEPRERSRAACCSGHRSISLLFRRFPASLSGR